MTPEVDFILRQELRNGWVKIAHDWPLNGLDSSRLHSFPSVTKG